MSDGFVLDVWPGKKNGVDIKIQTTIDSDAASKLENALTTQSGYDSYPWNTGDYQPDVFWTDISGVSNDKSPVEQVNFKCSFDLDS